MRSGDDYNSQETPREAKRVYNSLKTTLEALGIQRAPQDASNPGIISLRE